MVNNVIAFNSGCGDCSILDNERACMLVDYGGGRMNIKNILPDVVGMLNRRKEKSLMISHLHRDHYNGIRLLSNKVTFQNIYLPDYIQGKGLKLLACALLTGNSSIIIEVKQILQIPRILFSNKLIDNKSKIYFFVSGDKFNNKLDEFEVLLPKIGNINLPTNIIEKFNSNEELNNFVNEYSSIFTLNDEEDGSFSIKNNCEYILHMIDTLIIEEEHLFTVEEKRIIIKEFNKFHNEMSIVFQNEKNNGKNILFCADAESADLKLVSSKFFEKYSLIKIPHHGTLKKHFYANFPPSNKFIIFNGPSSNCSMITTKYDVTYGQNTKFYCSNPRCMYVVYNFICSSCNNNGICGFVNNFEIITL